MELETWNLKLIVLLLFCPLPALGQESAGRADEALQALSSEARAAVQQPATALSHPTEDTREGRVDRQTGVRRAIYRAEPLTTPASDPETAARQYLRREHESLGLSRSLDELRLTRVSESPAGHHLVFQQTTSDIPVYQGLVKVNLDRSLQPVSAFNSIYTRVDPAASSVQTTPSISGDQARQIVRDGVSNVGARTAPPELLVYPSDPPRLIWKVTAWPGEAAAEWVMLVDAHDGSFIYGFDAATRLHDVHRPAAGTSAPVGNPPSTGQSTSAARANGSGLVFDPDPLTTAGVTYGGSYVDNDDGDADVLSEELFSAPLRALTERNGEYYLEGPYARIVGTNPAYYPGSEQDSTNYSPPSQADPNDFTYTRGHPDFEAVNAYYHVDKSQRYLRGLDPEFTDRPSDPIRINPHGEEDDDNSFFYPSLNLISFGQGGVDDAEDADVIWHEYGHALLRSAAEGLLNGRFGMESRSFHEGWSDYWAGSYRRSLAADRSGLNTSDYEWRDLFPWDSGNSQIWPGRTLSHTGTYPSSMTYENSYQDGLLWATTLMDIFTSLETSRGPVEARIVSDRINLQSHYFVPPQPYMFTFRDAAEALLQADLLLYGGEHRSLLLDHLVARGFVDPSMYGPELSFDADTDLEHDAGELRFTVVATAREFSVQEVRVKYRRIGTAAPFQTAPLEQLDDSLYVGTVSSGDRPGLIEYYIDAADTRGITQTLPSSGPDQPFIAEVGNIDKSDLLAELQSTGDWHSTGTGWRVDSTRAGRSHLVIEPADLAGNSDVRTYVVLRHRYRMGPEAAGNVKISTDGGQSWELVHPHTQYPVSNVDIPGLQGEAAFSRGTSDESSLRSAFDLSAYAGQQIQLRLDFASTDEAGANVFWHVSSLMLYQATFDSEFSVSRKLALHSSYPNPFSAHTTTHFTLPSAGPVTVELYDALGRRVRLIRRQTYEAGTHTVRVNGSDLATGIYFVRLTTPGNQVTQPVRVVK